MPRGADVLMRVAVINNDGTPTDLSNAAITFTARDVANQLLFTPVLAVVTDELGGEATVYIPDDYTSALEPRHDYSYDLWIQIEGDDQPLLKRSGLALVATNFTEQGDYAPPLDPAVPRFGLPGFYVVPSDSVVGDLVDITGVLTAGYASSDGNPAEAIITSKVSATSARLSAFAIVGGFTGMTPGAPQYLGLNGERTETPPVLAQRIGTALDATTLLFVGTGGGGGGGSSSAYAQTVHVWIAADGDDGDAGNEAAPWLTTARIDQALRSYSSIEDLFIHVKGSAQITWDSTVDAQHVGRTTIESEEFTALSGVLTLAAGSTAKHLRLTGDPAVTAQNKLCLVLTGAAAGQLRLINGFVPRAPVHARAAGNVTLSGAQTVGGVSSVNGNRYLCDQQTTATDRLVWIANHSGAWTIALDSDDRPELTACSVTVTAGTYAGQTFYQIEDDVQVGTTTPVWSTTPSLLELSAPLYASPSAGDTVQVVESAADILANGNIFSLLTNGNVQMINVSVDAAGEFYCNAAYLSKNATSGQIYNFRRGFDQPLEEGAGGILYDQDFSIYGIDWLTSGNILAGCGAVTAAPIARKLTGVYHLTAGIAGPEDYEGEWSISGGRIDGDVEWKRGNALINATAQSVWLLGQTRWIGGNLDWKSTNNSTGVVVYDASGDERDAVLTYAGSGNGSFLGPHCCVAKRFAINADNGGDIAISGGNFPAGMRGLQGSFHAGLTKEAEYFTATAAAGVRALSARRPPNDSGGRIVAIVEANVDVQEWHGRYIADSDSSTVRTVKPTDDVLFVDNTADAVPIILPPLGYRYLPVRIVALGPTSAHAITLVPNGSDRINGVASSLSPTLAALASNTVDSDQSSSPATWRVSGGSGGGGGGSGNVTAPLASVAIGELAAYAATNGQSLQGTGVSAAALIAATSAAQADADAAQVVADAAQADADAAQSDADAAQADATDALAALAALTSDDSGNQSSVPGTTVTDALNNLQAQLAGGQTTRLLTGNAAMTTLTTAADYAKASNAVIQSKPSVTSQIFAFYRGELYVCGDGDRTHDFYCSGDGGTTARDFADIVAGDEVYWVGSVAECELAAGEILSLVMIQNGSGTVLSTDNVLTTANVTTADYQKATNTAVGSASVPGSQIFVFVNRQIYVPGDGTRSAPCYFSVDAGSTALDTDDIDVGADMYWVGSVAGFELKATDRLTIFMLTGGDGELSQEAVELTASVTTSDYDAATAADVGAATNASSWIFGFVNGVRVETGNGTRDDCEMYFSDDAGATALAFGDVSSTSGIYWVGSFAGYELKTTDRITLVLIVEATGGGGGGGGDSPVDSVFGRIGAVVQQAGDYAASQISNDAGIPGSNAATAMAALKVSIDALTAALLALDSDDIADLSRAPGATVTAALEALDGAGLTVTPVSNVYTINLALARVFALDAPSANSTVVFTGFALGRTSIIHIQQPGSGGPWTLTFASSVIRKVGTDLAMNAAGRTRYLAECPSNTEVIVEQTAPSGFELNT